MNSIKAQKNVVYPAVLIFLTALLTLLGLQAINRFDNKYTRKADTSQDGAVILPESGVSFLVNGFELYPDLLLSPADFTPDSPSSLPPHYEAWAGQYPNLASFHDNGNAYGISTWRLILRGKGQTSLYLQEPLCASRVFIDGRDLGGSGEVLPEKYRPLIRDSVYSFEADGETEIIIQTANYSHYYGGLWFPPAVGSPDSINLMISSRMIFYGLLCFSSLSLALFCLVLWLDKRERRDGVSFYFGLLCLFFALRVCYPFLRLWGIPLVRSLYALEDLAAMAGLYCAVNIVFLLFFPDKWPRLRSMAAVFSLGMCIVTVIVPLFILPSFPSFVLWYGPFISWYKVLCAVFLTGASLCGCLSKRPHAHLVLSAVTANGICLLYGVLSIGIFEPVIGGWPEEYGFFCMVLSFAGLMVLRNREMSAENLRLTSHLQEEVAEKTKHLSQLLTERGQLMSELGHDMKSPLTALSNMAQIILMNDIILDTDMKEKLQGIEEKCGILAKRLHSIQELAGETAKTTHMERLSLNQFLACFHRSNQPVVELTGPDFLCTLTPLPCRILADQEKLTRALENLVFNASEFTPPGGTITLSLERSGEFAVIRVSDTGCGIREEDLSSVFHRFYTTRTDEGGQGLGLAITHAIILEHNGEITVHSNPGEGTIFTIRLPLIYE